MPSERSSSYFRGVRQVGADEYGLAVTHKLCKKIGHGLKTGDPARASEGPSLLGIDTAK
jgi:hypothetical protein